MKNEPAFPSRQSNEHILYPDREYLGMSLRDYFAAKALGVISNYKMGHPVEEIALTAYALADAMLKEREK